MYAYADVHGPPKCANLRDFTWRSMYLFRDFPRISVIFRDFPRFPAILCLFTYKIPDAASLAVDPEKSDPC